MVVGVSDIIPDLEVAVGEVRCQEQIVGTKDEGRIVSDPRG